MQHRNPERGRLLHKINPFVDHMQAKLERRFFQHRDIFASFNCLIS